MNYRLYSPEISTRLSNATRFVCRPLWITVTRIINLYESRLQQTTYEVPERAKSRYACFLATLHNFRVSDVVRSYEYHWHITKLGRDISE